jgi:hypothetical protein
MLTPHAPPTDMNARTDSLGAKSAGFGEWWFVTFLLRVFSCAPVSSRRPARTAGRTTRSMSSSVNSDDMRPLVNSESLPSVSPVNLLGASSSYFVRMDNAHPRLYKPAFRALRLSQRC